MIHKFQCGGAANRFIPVECMKVLRATIRHTHISSGLARCRLLGQTITACALLGSLTNKCIHELTFNIHGFFSSDLFVLHFLPPSLPPTHATCSLEGDAFWVRYGLAFPAVCLEQHQPDWPDDDNDDGECLLRQFYSGSGPFS